MEVEKNKYRTILFHAPGDTRWAGQQVFPYLGNTSGLTGISRHSTLKLARLGVSEREGGWRGDKQRDTARACIPEISFSSHHFLPSCAFLCTCSRCHTAPSCSMTALNHVCHLLNSHAVMLTHAHTQQEARGAEYKHLMGACRCHSPRFWDSQLPCDLSHSLSLPCPPTERRSSSSPPLLFTHLRVCAVPRGRLLAGGGLSLWIPTGSLWPSCSLWVSGLPFLLSSCTGAAAAAFSAVLPNAGSAFPQGFQREDGQ